MEPNRVHIVSPTTERSTIPGLEGIPVAPNVVVQDPRSTTATSGRNLTLKDTHNRTVREDKYYVYDPVTATPKRFRSFTWATLAFTERPLPFSLPLQIMNILSFIAVIIINILANARVFGDNSTCNQVVARRPTLINPANWAFAIWGVVYFFLAIFVIFQALPTQRHNPVLFVGTSVYFILANLFNIAFMILFVLDIQWVAFGMITAMLVCLMLAYYRIRIGRRPGYDVSAQEYICVHIPLSLYMAWTSVCFSVSLAIALYWKGGWNGNTWHADGWGVLVVCILAAVAMILLAFRTDWVFSAVMVWAFFGIYSRYGDRWAVEDGGRPGLNNNFAYNHSENPWYFHYFYDYHRKVWLTAIILGSVLALLTVIALIVKFFMWRKHRQEYIEASPKTILPTNTAPVAEPIRKDGVPVATVPVTMPQGVPLVPVYHK